MNDLISRQAAINNIKNGFHWETVNGIMAQAVLKQVIHDIEIMPSTQPEIIRCKECKYASMTYSGECKYCARWDEEYDDSTQLYLDGDFYCGFAERRTDEQHG